MNLVTLEKIREAYEVSSVVALRTPLEHSRVLSAIAGGAVHMKCENLQRTGAFKIRGAYYRISRLTPEEKAAGVVAASAGNHAQGVALAASMLGVKARVYMPEGAPLPKVEATRSYGAEPILQGETYNSAYSAAEKFAAETGAVMVHPFDHPDIIAGQGSVALEILEQLPEAECLVVPVGGGGLIAGIATAAKALKPGIRVIGVEPSGAAALKASLAAGRIVKLEDLSTIADGLATKSCGELPFAHVQRYVDEVVTVTDDELAEALLLMLERAKLVVEPSGAAGVAAVMTGKVELRFPAVVLLSGGNIDPLLLLKVIRFGLGSSGRYFAFRTRISDRPGELVRLLGLIADGEGNLLSVEHHREGARLKHLGEVDIGVQVETKGPQHVQELRAKIEEAGYSVDFH